MPQPSRLAPLVVGLSLWAAACSGGSGADEAFAAPDGSGPLCVPGQSVGCTGVGQCAGVQVCSEDGSRFGACDCGDASDAGADDAADASADTFDATDDAADASADTFDATDDAADASADTFEASDDAADASADTFEASDDAADASADAVDATHDAADATVDVAAEAAVDASTDAAVDATHDAAVDASADAAVDAAVDATADAADAGSDALVCGAGTKLCSASCVSTADPAHGCAAASCGACSAPAHGAPMCASGSCAVDCDDGYNLCGGQCTADAVTSCGASCQPCATRPHATASCDGGACGWTCADGWGDCNGDMKDGCETNLATAVANCGACGHDCIVSGTCSAGRCEPHHLVSIGQKAPTDIVVDGDYLYWLDPEKQVIDKFDFVHEQLWYLAQSLPTTSGLAQDADSLYWGSDVDDGSIWRVPKSGATLPTELAKDLSTQKSEDYRLVVDDARVYWAAANQGYLRSVPKTGGTTSGHGGGLTAPRGIVLDGKWLYYTSVGEIAAVDVTDPWLGGFTVTTYTLYPNALAADADRLYVADPHTYQIFSASKGGGDERVVTDLAEYWDFIPAMLVDEHWVYWLNQTQGTLERAPKDGSGKAEIIASGFTQPTGLTTDGTSLFWTNTGDASIWRWVK